MVAGNTWRMQVRTIGNHEAGAHRRQVESLAELERVGLALRLQGQAEKRSENTVLKTFSALSAVH